MSRVSAAHGLLLRRRDDPYLENVIEPSTSLYQCGVSAGTTITSPLIGPSGHQAIDSPRDMHLQVNPRVNIG